MGDAQQRLGRIAASLDALSPFRVLSRGYSIAQNEDGAVLSTIDQVTVGDSLRVRLSDGTLTCTAQGKEKHL